MCAVQWSGCSVIWDDTRAARAKAVGWVGGGEGLPPATHVIALIACSRPCTRGGEGGGGLVKERGECMNSAGATGGGSATGCTWTPSLASTVPCSTSTTLNRPVSSPVITRMREGGQGRVQGMQWMGVA